MKNSFFAIFVSLSFFAFFSCSSQAAENTVEISTLKNIAGDLDVKTVWSEEMEGDVLGEKISGADGIASELRVGPLNVFLSGAENNYEKFYPAVEDFAVLDLSKIDSGAKNVLKNFCDSMVYVEKSEDEEKAVESAKPESFFDKSQVYSLVIFLYDFNELTSGKKILRYILGEPFCGEEFFQCPIRFYYTDEKGYSAPHVDVFVYLVKSGDSWVINQIELIGKKVQQE